MTGRTPPHNLEAEESLLGAMLLSIDAVRAAEREAVSPADFYKPAHGLIFAAVERLHTEQDPIDLVSVAEELARDGSLDAIGGRSTLLRLQTSTPASANAGYYGRVVAEYASLRRLIAAAGNIAELGYGAPGSGTGEARRPIDVDEVHALAQRIVAEAAAPGGRPDAPRTLDEFIAAGNVTPDWLIPGLIERMDRVLLTGGEGRGKSLFLRAFSVCAAAGLHPFDRAPVPAPVTTLLIEAESSERIMRGWLDHYRQLAVQECYDRGVPLPDWSNLRVEAAPQGLNLGTRGDRAWLEGLVAGSTPRPELVCIGPLYQMTPLDLRDEVASNAVRFALNELRGEYDVALLVEAHSPYADDGSGQRLLRPYGSSVWSRWPEMGVGLRAAQGGHATVEEWRPARDERPWPRTLYRAPTDGPIDWPWSDRPDRGRF